METNFESKKLDWCKDELKILIQRLQDGGYHQTAEVVFDHIAHTGVETDLDERLKSEPTLHEFINAD